MFRVVQFALLLSLIEFAFSAECDDPFVQVGSKCLWKSTEKATRSSNLVTCMNMDATLVTVRTPEENDQIKEFIKDVDGWFWLSAERVKDKDQTFKWIDGSFMSFDGWNSGQPNQLSGDPSCAQIKASTGWDDDWCSSKYMQMCEKLTPTEEQKVDESECDPGFTKVGSKCLWKSTLTATRDENAQKCTEMGATMASPKTSEENILIRKFISDTKNFFWLSGERLEEGKKTFVWADKSPMTYTDWNSGQPNQLKGEKGGQSSCIQVHPDSGWDDDWCIKSYMQLCEKPLKQKTSDNKEAKKEISDLKRKLKENERQLKKENDRCNEEKQKIEKEKDAVIKKLEDENKQKESQLNEKETELKNEKDHCSNEQKKAEEDKANAVKKLEDDLKNANNKLSEKETELEKEKGKCNKDQQRLKQENQGDAQKLEEKIKQMERTLSEKEGEIKNLKSSMKHNEQKTTNDDKRLIGKLNDELNLAKQKITEKENELNSEKNHCASSKQAADSEKDHTIQQLQNEKNELQNKLRKAETELGNEKARCSQQPPKGKENIIQKFGDMTNRWGFKV